LIKELGNAWLRWHWHSPDAVGTTAWSGTVARRPTARQTPMRWVLSLTPRERSLMSCYVGALINSPLSPASPLTSSPRTLSVCFLRTRLSFSDPSCTMFRRLTKKVSTTLKGKKAATNDPITGPYTYDEGTRAPEVRPYIADTLPPVYELSASSGSGRRSSANRYSFAPQPSIDEDAILYVSFPGLRKEVF